MVTVGNQGQDDRYIRLWRGNISLPVVSRSCYDHVFGKVPFKLPLLACLPVFTGPTNRTMYSNIHLGILKFSFNHSSTKFRLIEFRTRIRLARGQLERFVAELIGAFASTSLGAAKVRAAAVSIPGFADQEQENKTRGVKEPQLLF